MLASAIPCPSRVSGLLGECAPDINLSLTLVGRSAARVALAVGGGRGTPSTVSMGWTIIGVGRCRRGIGREWRTRWRRLMTNAEPCACEAKQPGLPLGGVPSARQLQRARHDRDCLSPNAYLLRGAPCQHDFDVQATGTPERLPLLPNQGDDAAAR